MIERQGQGVGTPMVEESTSEIAERYGDRGAVLARLSRDWMILHETPWPGRSDAVIDHVAIGPTGVFVIVVGDDPAQAVAAVGAVARLVPGLPREHLHGVLVGADHPAPWVEADGAILCESVDLARLLRSLPPVLTREEVAGVVGVVHVGLERADRARRASASASDVSAVDDRDAADSPGAAEAAVRVGAEVRRRFRARRAPR